MSIKYLLAKGLKRVLNPPAMINCRIDKNARVCSKSELSNVEMDRYSYIGNSCFMVNVKIGAFCSIADRCSIGGAMHPIERVSTSPVFHRGKNILNKNFAVHALPSTPKTIIENDVWLGMGCYIKAGVTIHNGAIVGMGSVVTHDIPAYEVWAGNPAKKIKDRFESVIKDFLLETKWWNWDENRIAYMSSKYEDPRDLMQQLEKEKNE